MDDWDSESLEEDVIVDGRLVLSASSVATFMRCGKQWEYAYVQKVKSPPSVRQALGLSAHTAYETDMLARLTDSDGLPASTVVDVFSDEYDRLVPDLEDPEEDPGSAKDQQVRVIQMYATQIAPTIVPIMVEQSFSFRINDIEFSGTLDLARIRPSTDPEKPLKVRVSDWKNSARKPVDNGQYAYGITGYAIGYRQLTDDIEDEVGLDVLVRHKRNKPDHYPITSGGPVSDRAIASFADTTTQVHNAIQRGDFMPNGLFNGACSWCGFARICPAYLNRN